ncbi:endonuclease/exonuclease/phosphatase family protein [Catenuloplanes atrovinosus]|uniref:Endonuclease/exonuclease/phosphatase family metal-dependent hydrolase n=1 Tax=Catenuloplanes atrovinosus TaxID=137266 RepID=A0AAE4C7K1_9ACTN|nr:endonuclease/exonuclease/phosphatase family protein [Catenuloplanes atrovinosus]MDR7273552.1 endonuclease/exonuclease/phosphatase family metal-dependent hydrolase [Catenuloplanes atrovinosus]
MRIAAYNVENLFNRARALDPRNWAAGRPVLEAFEAVTALLEEPVYTEEIQRGILRELQRLGLRNGDAARYARLRQNRGRLLRRSRDGSVHVVAGGRADWIGWVELTTERCDEVALANTARVLRDLRADLVGVVEAESRLALKRFADAGLVDGRRPIYPHVMVVDGNDERGIDVGMLSTADYPLIAQRSHVDDVDEVGRVFSRDCAEYHVATPSGTTVALLVNHFKSKGYGGKVASDAIRRRQAARVAAIYADLVARGIDHVAVVGDLNDTPDSEPLEPLLSGTDLRDVSTHPGFDDDGRPGTYGSCTARNKLDYVLLSPPLWDACTGGGILRRGVWGGRNGRLWPIYDTMTAAVHAGSDHAAIFADVSL